MLQGSNQSLLPENELRPTAIALSEQLEKINFDDTLTAALLTQKNALSSGTLLPSAYCDSDAIKEAMALVNNRNQYFLLGLFQVWRNQSHMLSAYETILLRLSTVVLLAAAVFTREALVLLFNDRPKLEATGNAIADVCAMGWDDMSEACYNLPVGASAILPLSTANNQISYVYDAIDIIAGPIPTMALQSLKSWLIPMAWTIGFVCSAPTNATIALAGHLFVGTMKEALEKASNGCFAVSTGQLFKTGNFLIDEALFSLQMAETFGELCTKIENGGAGLNKQHTDGYAIDAKSFEQNAYAFAGVYGGLLGLALLTFGIIMAKKVLAKWNDSQEKREEFSSVRTAATLFNGLHKKIVEASLPKIEVRPT